MTYPLLEIQVCSGRAETIFLSASGINFGAEYRMRRLNLHGSAKNGQNVDKKAKKSGQCPLNA